MISRHHEPDFADRTACPGYGKCRACGKYITREEWASEQCPGPTRKEEDE